MIPAPPNCLACGYPRDGLQPGARCPECGGEPPKVDEVVVAVRHAVVGWGTLNRTELVALGVGQAVICAILWLGFEFFASATSLLVFVPVVALLGCVILLPTAIRHLAVVGFSWVRLYVWLTPRGFAIQRGWRRVRLRPWPVECVVRSVQSGDRTTRIIVETFGPDIDRLRYVLSFDFEGTTEAADQLVNWTRRCCKA